MSRRRWFVLILALLAVAGLLVVAAGIYRFNFTQDDLYYRTPSGEVVSLEEWEARQAAGDDVMRRLFSIADGGPLALRLPELDQAVPLTRFEPEGEFTRVVGEYSRGAERGRIVMDTSGIRALNLSCDGRIYLVAPFSVSNQGSGVFHYLALLEHDTEHQAVTHVDSLFLGDRVSLEAVTPAPDGRALTLSWRPRTLEPGTPSAIETHRVEVSIDPPGLVDASP
ncbi:hypothetical protein PRZ61_01225 [Halomonas pacifica]|uniref:hypothetical protein n=1 Tax=Bisbaumannia pacifica TaxID=77098 RepID=UPI00235A46E1|nr:hypothetical protein [Halomonas pacifica]MDC8802069.1 hypothetical protein [Halomonas pacifica]